MSHILSHTHRRVRLKWSISLGFRFAGGGGGIHTFLSVWAWRFHENYERIAFNQSKCCRYLMAESASPTTTYSLRDGALTSEHYAR